MADMQISPAGASVRRMLRWTVIVAALGFALKSLVLSPIYFPLIGDIAYTGTWWFNVLYYLIDGGLIDLTVFAICYPATIYAIWCAGLKATWRIPFAFSMLTLVKFVINFCMTCIVEGALPSSDAFFMVDLPYMISSILPELFQYALVILCACLVTARYRRRMGQEPGDVFPFRRLVSLKNPVQCAAFLMFVILLIGRLINSQNFQYLLYITSGHTDGLYIMLLNLISDVFISVIVYFVALLLLSHFHRKSTETCSE